MSMYGPPGGGQYPGQPQDPWQGGGDPYGGGPYGGQPADPYGQPGGGPYGQPGPYGPPAGSPYGQPGYGQQQPGNPYDPYGQPAQPDPWGAPQQPMSGAPWGPPGPPHKSNTGLVVGLAAIAVLVMLIGAVVIFLLMDRETPTAAPSPSATASPSDAPTSAEPTGSPTKYDIDEAEEGDCLFDSNPDDTKANLSFASCDKRGQDYYKVLKRFDNTTDAKQCEDVPGFETSFTSNDGNFVLCVDELN